MQDQDRGVWPPPPDREPFGSRGHVGHPHNIFAGVPGLGLAMQMCRTQDETGAWVGLAHHVRRIPDEYVSTACTVGRGPEVFVVRCVCEQTNYVAVELVECGCGRWLFSGQQGVYAIRLPEQET